jgi:hypothetical protein
MIARVLPVLALLLLPAGVGAWGDEVFVAGTDSVVRLRGDTTLSSYACLSLKVDGRIESPVNIRRVDGMMEGFHGAANSAGGAAELFGYLFVSNPPRVSVAMRATAFACGNRVMNSDLHALLTNERYPVIRYTLVAARNVELVPVGDTLGIRMESEGIVELAGVRRHTVIPITAVKRSEDVYEVRGTKTFRMTEFGIRPPTALFGLIVADDELDVEFRITFVRPSSNAASGERLLP